MVRRKVEELFLRKKAENTEQRGHPWRSQHANVDSSMKGDTIL